MTLRTTLVPPRGGGSRDSGTVGGTFRRFAGACLVAPLTAACGSDPADHGPVGPDSALDPALVEVGDFIAISSCLIGAPYLPEPLASGGRALVDIVFIFAPRTLEDSPAPVTESERDGLVESLGGRIVHRFHLPSVRAEIDLERLLELVTRGRGELDREIMVREVPNPERFDVAVSLFFTRPITDADRAWIASLGGYIHPRPIIHTRTSSGLGTLERRGMRVDLPDRSVPALLDARVVQEVNQVAVTC